MTSLTAPTHPAGPAMAVSLLADAYYTESWGVAMFAVVIGGVGFATRSDN